MFKNAVTGIADYGNCLGIPTIGGEVEFDKCYKNYALVDVAAVGFGKKEKLIKNHASTGDLVVLIGGATGRDGIGGSQFASDSLEYLLKSKYEIDLVVTNPDKRKGRGLNHQPTAVKIVAQKFKCEIAP